MEKNKTAPARVAQSPAAKAAGAEVPDQAEQNSTAPSAGDAAAPTGKPVGTEASKAAENDLVVTQLQITARKPRFFRAGRAWGSEPTIVAVDEFTDEQIEQLLAEPMLIVLPIGGNLEEKQGE